MNFLTLRRWKDKLKAKLRDWCFADYKWITRAQVQGIICCKMWEYRKDSIVNQHVRKALLEVREDIDPAMRNGIVPAKSARKSKAMTAR